MQGLQSKGGAQAHHEIRVASVGHTLSNLHSLSSLPSLSSFLPAPPWYHGRLKAFTFRIDWASPAHARVWTWLGVCDIAFNDSGYHIRHGVSDRDLLELAPVERTNPHGGKGKIKLFLESQVKELSERRRKEKEVAKVREEEMAAARGAVEETSKKRVCEGQDGERDGDAEGDMGGDAVKRKKKERKGGPTAEETFTGAAKTKSTGRGKKPPTAEAARGVEGGQARLQLASSEGDVHM